MRSRTPPRRGKKRQYRNQRVRSKDNAGTTAEQGCALIAAAALLYTLKGLFNTNDCLVYMSDWVKFILMLMWGVVFSVVSVVLSTLGAVYLLFLADWALRLNPSA